jgi:hypothetical protein
MATDDAPPPLPASERPAWQRVHAIAAVAVIGGTLAYALCDWSGWTRLQLDPYDGSWWWQDGATRKVPINYYGGLLWALGGAAVGAGLATLVTALWRRPVPAAVSAVLSAWALTGVALTGAYYTWNLWPF